MADETVTQRSPNTVFAARRASIHMRPLLALLSLEGQSMGTGSLHRVKVSTGCTKFNNTRILLDYGLLNKPVLSRM